MVDGHDNALKIQVQRTAGSGTSRVVLCSRLTASQQRSLELLETAAACWPGR